MNEEQLKEYRQEEVERLQKIHNAVTAEFVALAGIGERLAVVLGKEPTAINTPAGRFTFQPKKD